MKIIITTFLCLLWSVSLGNQGPEERYFQQTIEGRYIEYIVKASEVFKEKLDRNFDDYIIAVREQEDEIIIICMSPRRLKEGILGRIKGFPEYTVEYDKDSGELLKGYYE